MGKGCGCFGFAAAVMIGLTLGLLGLGIAGYYWVNTRILSDEPMAAPTEKWSRLEEAALTAKLAPLGAAIKQKREAEQNLTLKSDEATRLLDQYLPRAQDGDRTRVEFGDTATAVMFSRRVREGKYLNGELRADVRAQNGDFEVSFYSLRAGTFDLPRSLFPLLSRWLEGELEIQAPFKETPLRIKDFSSSKNSAKLTMRVVKPESDQ